ncbi:MAG: CvpA family protein [Sedimentisphaerales bacterium]|nr:CvpA family protein [Sedimentisphaerales bacterium]
MATIAILIIMAACAAILFLKGTFLKSFGVFMAALCAAIVAFGWYEPAAGLLIARETIPNWAQFVSFLVLFVLSLAIFAAVVLTLARPPIDLGVMPERIGRVIFGLLTGLIISGSLITAAAMAPLSNSFPYQRFDAVKPDIQNRHKPLFNPDGFISGWFSIISRGSLNGGRSFAVLHAGLLDHLFLNRYLADKNVSILTKPGSVSIPEKAAAWPAPAGLKDISGAAIASKPDFDLVMVRVGFTARVMNTGGSFSLGQVRLIAKEKGQKHRLQGSAVSVYPAGYLKAANTLQQKGLGDEIRLTGQDVQQGTRWIDFAFYVPGGFEPAAVAFKTNDIAEVGPMVTTEQAPTPVPFIQSSNCATGFAKVVPAASAQIYGLELAGRSRLLEGARLKFADQQQWQSLQSQNSTMAARFDRDQITCVQAELVEPNQPVKENKLPQMLRPKAGYILLSLKCNTPAARTALSGRQLPTLIDSTGVIHHACGLIASGKVEGKTTFEADFCPEKLTFATDGSVAKPWPENIWLTEKAESVFDFYALFLVKPGTLIISIQPAGASRVGFSGTECFLVN